MTDACTHELRTFSEEELADLRRQARRDRPPMAWVEEAQSCNRCGNTEAVVSWFGQVYRVPVDRNEGGALAVRWPKRADAPGSGMSMG